MSKHLSQVKTENRIWENVLKTFLGMDWNLWYYVILVPTNVCTHAFCICIHNIYIYPLSWELTTVRHFWRWFPFSKVGYVSSLQIIYIYMNMIYVLVFLSRSHLIIMNLYFSVLSSLGWGNDSICSEVFWLATCRCLSRMPLDVNCFQWSNGERPVSKLEQDGKMWPWWI